MGLFSFLKGKKQAGAIPIPPSPPSSAPKPVIYSTEPAEEASQGQLFPQSSIRVISAGDFPEKSDFGLPRSPSAEEPIKAPRFLDDFGIPSKDELELPEIDIPKFKFPTQKEKMEIMVAIEAEKEKPALKPMPPKSFPKPLKRKILFDVPEKLPELGEPISAPKSNFPEEIEEPSEPVRIPKSKGHVFIKSDKFMLAKKTMTSVKDNMNDIDNIFIKMNEIKSKQDAELDAWHISVETVQRKLVYIDKTLFEK